MGWTEENRAQTLLKSQRAMIWLALARCRARLRECSKKTKQRTTRKHKERKDEAKREQKKIECWRMASEGKLEEERKSVGGGRWGCVGGVICLCQKDDERARRESSAVHLLASGGNALTLALPLPTSSLHLHCTCTIYDSQGRSRVARFEDICESSCGGSATCLHVRLHSFVYVDVLNEITCRENDCTSRRMRP